MKPNVKRFAKGGKTDPPKKIGGRGQITDPNRSFSGRGDVFESELGLPFTYQLAPLADEFNLTGAPRQDIEDTFDFLSQQGDIGTPGFYGPQHEEINRILSGERASFTGVADDFTPPTFDIPSEEIPTKRATLGAFNRRKTGGFQFGRNRPARGSINQGNRGANIFANIFGNLNRRPGTAAKPTRGEGGIIDGANQF